MTREEMLACLEDRPCNVCKYHTEKGCERWSCVFEEKPDDTENKGVRIHGHWERMSDLPEDKDDRYKCSRCGNVVHHSNGVNLYHFNSWCGRCGSLNNSLIAGLDPKGEKGD